VLRFSLSFDNLDMASNLSSPKDWFVRLPAHWQEVLRNEFPAHGGIPGAEDFGASGVQLRFEDGSTAKFEYAFFIVDDCKEELLLITEHCGYHVFSTRGLEVKHIGKLPP
jgi:hypothetical protein